MAVLVGISEGYEYQHNTTKEPNREPRKFKIRDTFWTDHVCPKFVTWKMKTLKKRLKDWETNNHIFELKKLESCSATVTAKYRHFGKKNFTNKARRFMKQLTINRNKNIHFPSRQLTFRLHERSFNQKTPSACNSYLGSDKRVLHKSTSAHTHTQVHAQLILWFTRHCLRGTFLSWHFAFAKITSAGEQTHGQR